MPNTAQPDHIDWFSEVPRSIRTQTTAGVLLMLGAFGSFGFWAVTAPLAAAVIAQGSFVATGQNKIIQHLEGGIIKDILVSEGDQVTAGAPIVLLDETAARANERELLLRQARLEAINARLQAEVDELSEIRFPDYLVQRRHDPEFASILDSQRQNFDSSQSKMESDVTLLESNIEALRFRANGYDIQRAAVVRQLDVLGEELETKTTLFDGGLVRKSEVNAIRTTIADAEGQLGRLESEVAETQSMIAKHSEQIEQTRRGYRQAALDEMQAVLVELDGVREQARNAESVLRRASINTPVSGIVVRMYYHTSGGVIEGGKSIAEILPADAPLMIEAQIPRTEIDSVHVGQSATVRLIAVDQRTTPVLNGQVYYVSADSLPDPSEALAKEVYLARVSLPVSELQRVKGFSPTPGMPVEILIQTAERTFFQYLTKPIVDSMSRAFREM